MGSCASASWVRQQLLQARLQLLAVLAQVHVSMGAAVSLTKMCYPCLSCHPTPNLCAAASRPELPAIASLQNAYSLLCRTFDAGLAECCHAERVSLLAYSPLAMVRLGGAQV